MHRSLPGTLAVFALAFLLAAWPGRSFGQEFVAPSTGFPGVPFQPQPPPFPPTPPPFPPTPPDGTEAAQPSFVEQGELDFKAANYVAAIRDWQHALIESPDNGGVLLLLGQALFATGQFDNEFQVTRRALEHLPADKWGEVIKNYSELYRDNKQYTDQLRALEKKRRAGDAPELRFLLGYHYGYLGYPKEAVRELDKAIEMAPQDELARKLRAQFVAGVKSPATPGK
jgi:tetratricopeptide (TPR) repeat protein